MDGAPGGGPPPPPPPLGRPDNGRGGPPAAEHQQNGDVPDQNGNGGSRPLGPQPAPQQGPQMIGPQPQPQQQIGPQQEQLDPAEAERRQHAKLWDGVAHNLKANSNGEFRAVPASFPCLVRGLFGEHNGGAIIII